MLVVAVAVVVLATAYLATAATTTTTSGLTYTAPAYTYTMQDAQPYVNQALQAVRDGPFLDIFRNLFTVVAAYLSGDHAALTPEVLAGAQSGLSMLVMIGLACAVVAMVAAVIGKVAKLGFLVALVVGVIVYAAANYPYLLAPLGL